MDIQGKAAVITGGGTGVGRATALLLARQGCSVLVNYSRSKDEAEATAAEIRGFGVGGEAWRGDVSVDADCRAIVAEAERAFGRLDVLVQSAGTTSFIQHEDLEGVKDEDWDRILGVNLRGPFQMARAAKRLMDDHGGGEIINVSSIAGIAAVGSSIPYCASKAALNNLTVALARVLAPKIRVNAVAPGFITGRWLEAGLGEAYEPMKRFYESKAPLGKVCDPEDVAAAVMGLVTGSDLVTGQVVVVDGGMLLAR
jgi:3-oxoacyl-[acyl-carrier protein] reductase